MKSQKQVVLITGASSGIGRESALQLQKAGLIVYAAARRVSKMADLIDQGVHVLKVDVTKDTDLTQAVQTIMLEQGQLDILINNAGYGSYGALEDVPLSEGEYQFKVNLFGVMRLTQLVLPIMRQQGHGRIINTSSIGGQIYQPMGAWYMGTKHALEGMTDSLRVELAPFGIDVIMIEPGAIKTEWPEIAEKKLLAVSGQGPYAKQAQQGADLLALMQRFSSRPSVIAKVMVKAVLAPKPKTRYHAGLGATLALAGRHWLSDHQFDAMIEQTIQGATKLNNQRRRRGVHRARLFPKGH